MSHRVSAAVLLATGVLLAAAGPVLHFAVLPAVRVAPWDPDDTTVSTGQGRYLDPTTGAPGTGLVTVTEHIQGDPAVGRKHHAAVWTITTRVDTPSTIALADARQALQLSVHRWTFDRVTNQYVPCCGADTGQGADAFRKFPFHAEALSYRLWDPEAARAFPAQLDGTREIDGHAFNAYVQTIPPTEVGTLAVPPGVLGVTSKDATVEAQEWYQNPQTVTLVDPETGTPVSVTTHEIVTLRLPGDTRHAATALDVTLRTTQDTEQQLVDQATGQATELSLLEGPVPWLVTALGVVLAALGALRTHRRAVPGVPGLPGGGAGGADGPDEPEGPEARTHIPAAETPVAEEL
ncbi:DUF3068 domain-containing protein [Streptacidiphilus melanogenes]|uniref:DUF3068 domain-containing protein n=1 Tax=Streptacidiphilus melanogenes TaxID=411235 RepID=UPI0005A7EF71|nr:DUF3068 domain-containing protein [Streptacidiphilus melanogenes]